MRELTCIVCPIGCSLLVENFSTKELSSAGGVPETAAADEDGQVFKITGNRCPRGAVYAKEEICAPKRVVTATCGFDLNEQAPRLQNSAWNSLTAPRRVPVKTSTPCPKEKITELLGDIYRLKVSLPVKAGDKLIADWQGRGIDVVAVRSLE